MTEEQYQKARKIMASANNLRGKITKAKNNVKKWTAFEADAKKRMNEGQVEGCQKATLKAIELLAECRKKFADLKFPE